MRTIYWETTGIERGNKSLYTYWIYPGVEISLRKTGYAENCEKWLDKIDLQLKLLVREKLRSNDFRIGF